jgi:hypothetical protein
VTIRVALRCASLLGALAACTNTLDPTVLVAADGAAGSPSDALATCSLFTMAPNEYVICPQPLDFAAAEGDCARRSATLAAVGSTDENEFVATSAHSLVNDNLWLGGTRGDDYVWHWPDGSVFWRGGPNGNAENGAFVTWVPGEPNDSSTVTTDPERCLALTFTANGWNDRACSLRLPYICEHLVPSP